MSTESNIPKDGEDDDIEAPPHRVDFTFSVMVSAESMDSRGDCEHEAFRRIAEYCDADEDDEPPGVELVDYNPMPLREYWHITYFGIPTQQDYHPQYRAIVVDCSIADWIKAQIIFGPNLRIGIVSAWPLTKQQYDEINSKLELKPEPPVSFRKLKPGDKHADASQHS